MLLADKWSRRDESETVAERWVRVRTLLLTSSSCCPHRMDTAVCLCVRLWYQVSQLSVKVMNEKKKKNLCSIVFYEVVEFHVSVVFVVKNIK
ncbi:hypothetical protein Bca4012_092167 [Brassica carinata]